MRSWKIELCKQGDQSCYPLKMYLEDNLVQKYRLCIIVYLVRKKIIKFGGLELFGLVFIKNFANSVAS